MEENYRLVKDYKISHELFKDAYHSYQKKYIYPKSYIFMAIFLLLSVDFIIAAVKEPSNKLVYLLIFVCVAFAFREWFNPRKIRNNIVDTVKEMGEPTYRIGIADDYIDISTIEIGNAENYSNDPEEDELKYNEEYDPMPEKTTLAINDDLKALEYDKYFLIVSGKRMFYILPKEGFSEEENEIIRNINTIS